MDKYLATNQQSWDHRTKEHIASKFYDVKSFINGKNSLNDIELNELGDVKGKSLLHLQCHFGLDSLSLARLGAHVTGIDISSESILQASKLRDQLGLEAEFICSDVYSIRDQIDSQFDIVYTSYGVIAWLPDLEEWAKIIASSLATGGIFYMVEFHPFLSAMEGEHYFHKMEPDSYEEVSYTENASTPLPLHSWSHPISSVINALIRNGLKLSFFNEFPFSPYNCFDNLIEREPGKYYRTTTSPEIPMLFSLKAIKESLGRP
jgi:SAM-dependent methyltransferase